MVNQPTPPPPPSVTRLSHGTQSSINRHATTARAPAADDSGLAPSAINRNRTPTIVSDAVSTITTLRMPEKLRRVRSTSPRTMNNSTASTIAFPARLPHKLRYTTNRVRQKHYSRPAAYLGSQLGNKKSYRAQRALRTPPPL